jgi:hypothetical protein
MEKNLEVAYYVVRWYAHLMTQVEWRAQRHLFATMKATRGRSDKEAQREAQKSIVASRYLSDERDVLGLASGGYEAFVERTAARILDDCRNEVFFNRCPKCGGLARTPTAKQCRFCRFCAYDWHDGN